MKRILCLFLILFSLQAFGQKKFQKSINISYESGPFTGTGDEWSNTLNEIIEFRAIDVKVGWKKLKPDHMEHLYRFPTLGFGFTTALPYFEEIGRPMAFYTFMDLPFERYSPDKKLRFGMFGQMGIGFNANPYDEVANPLNNYLGSQMNIYVHLGLNASYKVTKSIDLTTSVGLKHYSNGASTKPNKGLNMVPLSIGLRTYLGPGIQEADREPQYPDLEKRGFWNFALYTGVRNYEIGDPAYFRGGLGVNYLWEASYKYRLGLGVDMFYAAGLEDRYPGEDFNLGDKASVAIVGSWEWKLTEQLYVPIALGVYVHRTDLNQEITQYYERIGVRWRTKSGFFTGLSIKAHKAKADFFEFTFGYTVPGKVKYVRSPKN